jgi:hypothetical protein
MVVLDMAFLRALSSDPLWRLMDAVISCMLKHDGRRYYANLPEETGGRDASGRVDDMVHDDMQVSKLELKVQQT